MKKIRLIIMMFVCLGFTISSLAQKGCSIQKVYAFFMVNTPGNIPVDNNGMALKRASDTVYTIYVETKGKQLPKWERGKKGNMYLNVVASNEEMMPLKVNQLKNKNQGFAINPAKGNRLFKLELQVGDVIKDSQQSPTNITLQGKCGTQKITQVINNIIELEAPLYP